MPGGSRAVPTGRRNAGWSFEPDWLISGGDKDHAVLEELSTCPSWLTLENTRQNASSLNITQNMTVRRLEALADTQQSLSKASSRIENELREARNQISLLQAELHQREALTRHTKAQNLVLRSELAGCKKNVADLNAELKDLHDHVHFLRHITAPTPDAGALDASLAMLRGHELEQARSREKETRAALCTSETAREQIQIDLENEKQNRNASETSFQAEIDRLNLEIARFSALHISRENKNITDEARYRESLSHQDHNLQRVIEDMKRDREAAVARENEKWREEIAKKEAQHKKLNLEIDDLKRTVADLGTKNREQQSQLDLAWAEVRGRNLPDPRRPETSDRNTLERELARQKEKLMAEFDRERAELRREIAHLNQFSATKPVSPNTAGYRASVEVPRASKTHEIGVNTEKDPLLDRLGAYHAQLQLATDELTRSSEDNKFLFGKLVAAYCAIKALHRHEDGVLIPAVDTDFPGLPEKLQVRINELEENQNKLSALAEMWEEQANELENTLADQERITAEHKASLDQAEQTSDKLRQKLAQAKKESEERIEAERTLLQEKLDQVGDALDRSARRIEDQEHRIVSLGSRNEDLERTKSVLEADLAIAENEVIRLRTELARKKMELTRAERTRNHASTQTNESSTSPFLLQQPAQILTREHLDREKKRWEAEKNKELKALERKFASSFKKQVAKVLGSRQDLPRKEAPEMSLVSVDTELQDAQDQFNIQDCTPPVVQLTSHIPVLSSRGVNTWDSHTTREFPTVPRQLLPAYTDSQQQKENSAANSRRWDPEESYARWKKQQEKKKSATATVIASTTTSKEVAIHQSVALASTPEEHLGRTPQKGAQRPVKRVTEAGVVASAMYARREGNRISTQRELFQEEPNLTSTRYLTPKATPSSATPSSRSRTGSSVLKSRVSSAYKVAARSPPSPPPHISRRKPVRVTSGTTTTTNVTPASATTPSSGGRRRPAFR